MTIAKKIPYTVDCALTVTYQPKLFKHTPPMQYRETYSALSLHLLKNNCKYVIVPELTPKNENIHYHVLIKLPLTKEIEKKGVLYVLRNMFRNVKDIGYTVIKKCEDTEGWWKYMTKELPHTINILDLLPEYIDEKKLEYKLYDIE